MPRFARFADVLDVDDDALAELVTGDGDEPERVWAAWVIGLRRRADAASVLGDRAMHEPSPGVRAHLPILLVAHGQRAAAVALARRDPSSTVRASAYRCLARVAAPEDRELCDLLAHALGTEVATEVKAAILDGLRADAPPALRERALQHLTDDEVELRTLVVDFALRSRGPGEAFPRLLCDHAPRETDAALFGVLLGRWMTESGASALLRELPAWPADALGRALDHCAAEGPALQASDLEPLLARGEPSLDERLAKIVAKGRLELPTRWLLRFVARYLRETVSAGSWTERRVPMLSMWHAAQVACGRLPGALAEATATSLSDEERGLVAELRTRIEEDVREVCAPWGIEVDALVRHARGEDLDEDMRAKIDGVGAWDDELYVFGIELVPELRRLS